MSAQKPITLFHCPQSRSTGVLNLLEELGAPYTLKILNMNAGEQRQPKYLAMNPMGKVPAILHGRTFMVEAGGQDLFIDAQGHGNPHLTDQLVMHAENELKRVELVPSVIESTAAVTVHLRYY